MIIRNASASDSVEIITSLAYNAGPEIYDYLYKTDFSTAIDYLKFEFKSGIGLCGYNNFVVGSIEDNPILTASFYDSKQYLWIALGTIVNVIRFFGLVKSFSVIRRIIDVARITKCPQKDEIFLANFSVHKDYRGKGLGTLFLKTKSEQYRKEQFKILGLDVLMGNDKVERLYTRLGCKIVEERIFHKGTVENKIPGTKKMELMLKGL